MDRCMHGTPMWADCYACKADIDAAHETRKQRKIIRQLEQKVVEAAIKLMEWTFPEGQTSQLFGELDEVLYEAVRELKAARGE